MLFILANTNTNLVLWFQFFLLSSQRHYRQRRNKTKLSTSKNISKTNTAIYKCKISYYWISDNGVGISDNCFSFYYHSYICLYSSATLRCSFLKMKTKTAEVGNDDRICFTHTGYKQWVNQSLYHIRKHHHVVC